MIHTSTAPKVWPRIQRRRLTRRMPIEPFLAAVVILASTAATILYVWAVCPLDLAPDEAHYWDWSRHLDWSYYSKGPLVAWLIRASCELFGPLSQHLTGSLAAAVRLPAALCHAATLAAWYVLAAGVFRSPRFGLAVVGGAALLPVVRIGAVIMTIDPPFLACWSWALVCVWRALHPPLPPALRGKRRGVRGEFSQRRGSSPPHPGPLPRSGREGGCDWWIGAGVATALGVLAKYTMMLFPVAVVGYLLVHRRREFRRAGVWFLLAGAAAGWLPILAWNAGHDWVSFRHVFGQVGGGTGGIRWLGPVQFFGGQAAMMFGLWLVAFLAAARRFRPTREMDVGIRLLWWSATPVWATFAIASLVKSGQANWPAPAYVGGFILAVAWVREKLAGPRGRLALWCVGVNVALGLVVAVGIHYPGPFQPLAARLVAAPSERDPTPVRRLDITARLHGWPTLAAEVDRLRNGIVSETGDEPVLAGTHWSIPAQLRFLCAGHPDAYAIGIPNHSDRHSQYDLWRPNPVADAQVFRGRTFVIVGEIGPEVASAFDRVEKPVRVTYAENGIPLQVWAIWVCHGFRGFVGNGWDVRY